MSDELASGQVGVLPDVDGGVVDSGEARVSDPLVLTNAPGEWHDYPTVSVCGNEHPLREFTMEERALWRKVRDQGNLDDVIQEFETVQEEIRSFDVGGLAEAYEKRAQVIDRRLTELIERTPIDKWDVKVEREMDKLVSQREELLAKSRDLLSPKRRALAERSPELMEKLEVIRERQGNVFLEFVWNIARREFGEKRSLEEYIGDARGSDRLAAQEVVEEGNFTWEAHGLNRGQRRKLLNVTRSRS